MSNQIMGLEEASSQNTVYLNIVGGKFARRVDESDPKGVARVIKDKQTGETIKTVHEIIYSSAGGLLEKAWIKDGKFGQSLELRMKTPESSLNISVPFESGYGKTLACRVLNIDTALPFALRPYNFVNDEGYKTIGVSVIQPDCGHKDDKVPAVWSRSEPGDMPPPVKRKKGGKDVWDWTDNLNFLYEQFEAWCETIDNSGVKAPEPIVEEIQNRVSEIEDEEDDLPF